MKAAAFDYVRASSVPEALDLLARHGDSAKIVAGGQSLMPALNLRLLAPSVLIDIGRIEVLRGIAVEDGTVRIGALTRQADLMASPIIAASAPLLTAAIAHVAHPAIRNRGTIGGNLAHADPASELPACMMALGAEIVIQSPGGERRVPAADFFTGIYETALEPGELLVAVELPDAKPGQRMHFEEYARRSGDYAIVGLAAQSDVADGIIHNLRLAYFAAGPKATLAAQAAARIVGRAVTPEVIAEGQAALADDLDPQDDQQASAAMRLHLARTLLAGCIASLLNAHDNKGSAAA